VEALSIFETVSNETVFNFPQVYAALATYNFHVRPKWANPPRPRKMLFARSVGEDEGRHSTTPSALPAILRSICE